MRRSPLSPAAPVVPVLSLPKDEPAEPYFPAEHPPLMACHRDPAAPFEHREWVEDCQRLTVLADLVGLAVISAIVGAWLLMKLGQAL